VVRPGDCEADKMPRPWLRNVRSDGREAAEGPGLLRRFKRSQEGATAVEFGMLALPFLFLMFAILEIAMVFWSTQVLETAVANAGRQVYTGQFQGDPANANKTSAELGQKFKDALCANVTALFNCAQAVSVDIRNFSSYSGATPPSATTNGAYDTASFGYQNVGPNQIALVTAAMEYTTVVKMLSGTTGLSNGNRLIMATTTFRTEPYSN